MAGRHDLSEHALNDIAQAMATTADEAATHVSQLDMDNTPGNESPHVVKQSMAPGKLTADYHRGSSASLVKGQEVHPEANEGKRKPLDGRASQLIQSI